MVAVNGAIVYDGHCVSWQLLPLMILEGFLALSILWRTVHQVQWKSHPRRISFHLVLLVACAFRWVFWLALCHISMLAQGQALLWWSNSLILLSTALIIVQWSSAVDAGRVAVRDHQRGKRFSLHHPLVFLHSVHLLCSIGGGIDVMTRGGLDSLAKWEQYLDRTDLFLAIYRGINVTTVVVDAVTACFVARRLRARLLAAAMSDEMKHKSVIQMTLLIFVISIALLIQLVMDIPVLISDVDDAWGALSYLHFCVVKYFIPCLLLSICFLYIMRRVEQREPVRLVVMPTASSLVEFEECASPCMWCQHHRRYHVGQNKWDATFLQPQPTGFSPRTVDSSFRSAISATNHVATPTMDWGNGQ